MGWILHFYWYNFFFINNFVMFCLLLFQLLGVWRAKRLRRQKWTLCRDTVLWDWRQLERYTMWGGRLLDLWEKSDLLKKTKPSHRKYKQTRCLLSSTSSKWKAGVSFMHPEKSLLHFRCKAGCRLIYAKFCFLSESDHILVMIFMRCNSWRLTWLDLLQHQVKLWFLMKSCQCV